MEDDFEPIATLIGVTTFKPDRTGLKGTLSPVDNQLSDLLVAGGEVSDLADVLISKLGIDTEHILNPTMHELENALNRTASRKDSAASLLHILSHGEVTKRAGNTLWIASNEATRQINSATWVQVNALIANLAVNFPQGPPILVTLDVCSAGTAAEINWLNQRLEQDGRRIWVVAAAEHDHSAYDGRFTRAFHSVLAQLARGELDVATEYLSLDLLVSSIWQEMNRQQTAITSTERIPLPQKLRASSRELGDMFVPRLFPNPNWNAAGPDSLPVDPTLENVLDETLGFAHFRQRAAGVPGILDGPCCFTGRVAEMSRLSEWINSGKDASGSLRIMTGSPGSGKSALLGALACIAHPDLQERAPNLISRISSLASPLSQPVGTIAAVHARGRSLTDLVTSISRQLNLDQDDQVEGAATSAPTTPELLRERLRALDAPPLVILDALDEAADPVGVMQQLLIPMLDMQDSRPLCRLLIGVRNWSSTFQQLFNVGNTEPNEVLDLDLSDRDDLRLSIAAYVLDLRRILAGRRPISLSESGAWRTIAKMMAATLVDDSTSNGSSGGVGAFLLAQLYVNHIVERSESISICDDTAEGIGLAVPTTVAGALQLDARRPSAPRLFYPLLVALAQSHGDGMPRELVKLAAYALSDETLQNDQAWRSAWDEARFYLRAAVDSDGSVLYRLFHQSLIDTLRESAFPASRRDRYSGTAKVVYSALYTSTLEPAIHGYHDELAIPYLRRHLAQHALSAGRLDELLVDAEYLVHGDPDSIVPALPFAQSDAARLSSAIYRSSIAVHRLQGAEQRRQLLAMDSLRYNHPELAQRLVKPGELGSPRWSTGSDVSPQLRNVLSAGEARLRDVACTQMSGRPVAIANLTDGSVGIWDLATGRPIGEPIGFKSHAARHVCCGELGRGPVAVTASSRGRVRISELSTGKFVREFSVSQSGGIADIDFAHIGRRPIVVVAGRDGAIRVWNLTDGRYIGRIPTNHRGGLWSMACTRFRGKPIAITGNRGSLLKIWDLSNGRPMGEIRTNHYEGLGAVACARLGDQDVVVTGGFTDGSIQFWDLATQDRLEHSSTIFSRAGVRTLACSEIDGQPVLVTGSTSGLMNIWDVRTQDPVGAPRPGTGLQARLVCSEVDGRALAVTGGRDQLIRRWDVLSGELVGQPFHAVHTKSSGARHTRTRSKGRDAGGVVEGIGAIAFGYGTERATLITGGRADGIIRKWDLASGKEIGSFTRDNSEGISDIVTVTTESRLIALIRPLAGSNVRARAWDLGSMMPEGRRISMVGRGGILAMTAYLTSDFVPVALTGGSNGELRVWDMRTGGEMIPPVVAHPRGVTAVTCCSLDGQQVVVTGGETGQVKVWHAASIKLFGKTMSTDRLPVLSLSVGTLDKSPIVVIGLSRELRVVDLRSRQVLLKIPIVDHDEVSLAKGALILRSGRDLLCYDFPGLIPNVS